MPVTHSLLCFSHSLTCCQEYVIMYAAEKPGETWCRPFLHRDGITTDCLHISPCGTMQMGRAAWEITLCTTNSGRAFKKEQKRTSVNCGRPLWIIEAQMLKRGQLPPPPPPPPLNDTSLHNIRSWFSSNLFKLSDKRELKITFLLCTFSMLCHNNNTKHTHTLPSSPLVCSAAPQSPTSWHQKGSVPIIK